MCIRDSYVAAPGQLGKPDLIILPGTKNTMDDLLWMRQNGLEAAVQKHAAAGKPILGVCGGFQMLGRAIRDPLGVEHGGEISGMGLLPLETEFAGEKTRVRAQGVLDTVCLLYTSCGKTGRIDERISGSIGRTVVGRKEVRDEET